MEILPPKAITGRLSTVLTNHDPARRLRAIAELRTTLDAYERDAVREMRDSEATWDKIAAALGVTKQAAHQRLAAATDLAPDPPQSTQRPAAAGATTRRRPAGAGV